MRNFQIAGWTIIIAAILILTLLWLTLTQLQKRADVARLDPYQLIPSDAWVIADIKNPAEIASVSNADSLFGSGLFGADQTHWLGEKWRELDTLFKNQTPQNDHLLHARVMVSLHPLPVESSAVLLQIRFGPQAKLKQLERFFRAYLIKKPAYDKYEFLGATIKHYKEAGKPAAWFAFYKGSLLVSASQRLIEHAIAQHISNTSVAASAPLKNLRAASGIRSDHIFIDGGRLCELFEKWPSLLELHFFNCKTFSGWLGWDLAIIEVELRFLGFASSDVEKPTLLSLFAHQQPSKPNLLEFIPSSTAAFVVYNFDNTEDFTNSVARFKQQGLAEQTADSAFQAKVWQHLGNSIAVGLFFSPDSQPDDSGFCLIELTDSEVFWEKLNNNEFSGNNEIKLLPLDTVFESIIWQLSHPEIIAALGLGFAPQTYSYFSIIDSVLLAGASAHVINRMLLQFHYGQLLMKDPRMSDDFIFQQTEGNLFYMQNLPLLRFMHSNEPGQTIESGLAPNKINRISAQFSAHRQGMFFSNISVLRKSPGQSAMQRPLWTIRLDTIAHTAPYSVFNHNDGSRELIIQDAHEQLYLMDRFGRILWKKKINGLLNSDIIQVDRFRNGRYQYLFTTGNTLHLIDRNGNYVRGFPLQLPSAVASGISVVDYDTNKNYRILFVGEDKRLYNVGLDGGRVSGWLLPRLENIARVPVQYFRLDQRDYLFVVDTIGKPYFFDRRGRVRLSVPEAFGFLASNQVFTSSHNDKAHFVALGKEGEVLEITTEGLVNAFMLDSLNKATCFLFIHKSSKDNPLFIFSSQNSLKAFDRIGDLLFEQKLNGQIKPPIHFIRAANKEFLAVKTMNPSQVYLFDTNGSLQAPFPLRADKMFFIESLMQDNTWHALSVYQGEITAWLLDL